MLFVAFRGGNPPERIVGKPLLWPRSSEFFNSTGWAFFVKWRAVPSPMANFAGGISHIPIWANFVYGQSASRLVALLKTPFTFSSTGSRLPCCSSSAQWEIRLYLKRRALIVGGELPPRASLTYWNPSTRTMSPSACSIPVKRKVRPSGERLVPQRANTLGRSAILRTCCVEGSK
jgi:hypothetical protein